VIASIAMLCASVWAVVAPSAALLTPAFMFMGINLGIEMMVRFNMAIEYCPPEQRSRYVGLTSTVLAPFYLAGLAGGLLIDGYGFSAVFIAGIIFSLVGSALLVWRVRDPRALVPVHVP
jgi:MFS family permease